MHLFGWNSFHVIQRVIWHSQENNSIHYSIFCHSFTIVFHIKNNILSTPECSYVHYKNVSVLCCKILKIYNCAPKRHEIVKTMNILVRWFLLYVFIRPFFQMQHHKSRCCILFSMSLHFGNIISENNYLFLTSQYFTDKIHNSQ